MRTPRNHQTERVTKIVSGIRKKRHRMCDDAIEDLDRDQRHVKGRRDREHWAEVFRCMRVPVVMPMAVHDRHISIVGQLHYHRSFGSMSALDH